MQMYSPDLFSAFLRHRRDGSQPLLTILGLSLRVSQFSTSVSPTGLLFASKTFFLSTHSRFYDILSASYSPNTTVPTWAAMPISEKRILANV